MTEALCRKQHSKRFPGITETMHNTLLQARRQADQVELIDDLMQKLNSPQKNTLPDRKQPTATLLKTNQLQYPQKDGPNNANRHHPQTSVARKMGGLLQPAHQGLRRMLSVDKVSIRMNASRIGKPGKAHTPRLLAQPVAVLSKKSTGYSTQSQEEALKEENEWFRELCAAEEGRLLRLEKEIENENKVQLIRRQLYEESIRKLKRMAGEDGLLQEGSSHHQEESCEECDGLSVASR